MIPFHYPGFKVEIKNLKFITEDGIRLPKTAIISFLDDNNNVTGVEILGHLDNESIYKKIASGEPVILDYCYIHNFSLSDYRHQNGMDKKARVALPSFSARHAFFDSKPGTDFSYAQFLDGDVSFEHAHFVNGPTTFNSAQFGKGSVNFSSVFFREGQVDFSNVSFGEGEVNFKNSVFCDGLKDFQYAEFGPGPVFFSNTEFHAGTTSFINASFGDGPVSFKIARFTRGNLTFHYARFGSGDKSFERVEFGDCRVDFRKVEFGNGRINFNRSVFGTGDVNFEGSEISDGRFSMNRVQFGRGEKNFELAEYGRSEVFFDRSDLGQGNLSFQRSKFRRLSLKSCHLDHYLDLRVSRCDLIDLSDTIARDIIDLQPHDYSIDLKTLDISGMRLLGRIYIDWKNNRVKSLISSQTSTTVRQKAEQFRTLKENFNTTGKYNDEDRAYVEFKRQEMVANLREHHGRNPWSRLWTWPAYGFQWLIFDKMGLFATNPLRVLGSMLVGYLLFSLVYFLLMLFSSAGIVSSIGDPDHLSTLAVAFYHSAITFLTIGYGDYYPSGAIRIISGFEGFVGLFLMSYFTVAFVRKILR